MTSKRGLGGLLGGLAVLALLGPAARAEDFSIHLDLLAEIDTDRALPEYTLKRVPARNEWRGRDDMPLATFDVHMRFKEFGDVYLDKGTREGPSTRKDLPPGLEGVTVCGRLANLDDVKAGWIKDSPGLLLVAWVSEHGGGNNRIPDHYVAVLQLADGKANVVARRAYPCGIRTIEYAGGWPLVDARFSWDARGGRLVERIGINRVVEGAEAGSLRRPAVLDDAGTKGFRASLEETVTVSHAIVDGKLVAQSAVLKYKAQKNADMAEVAAFYQYGETRHG
jgi:hypothetical protein